MVKKRTRYKGSPYRSFLIPLAEISYYRAVTFLLVGLPSGKIPKDPLFLTVDFVTATRIHAVQLESE